MYIFIVNTAVEPKEPLPRDVNMSVPLTIQKLMPFIPQMAADYEVIGILLGQEDSVRGVRTGPGDARQKMLRILEEWKGTEEASWSALIEALENYTPHLCGVASGIRVFLRNELAKGEQMSDLISKGDTNLLPPFWRAVLSIGDPTHLQCHFHVHFVKFCRILHNQILFSQIPCNEVKWHDMSTVLFQCWRLTLHHSVWLAHCLLVSQL